MQTITTICAVSGRGVPKVLKPQKKSKHQTDNIRQQILLSIACQLSPALSTDQRTQFTASYPACIP